MAAPIFISHAVKDRRVAATVCEALENCGLSCWISGRDIAPGDNFQVAIVRAIRAAKAMVLIFSANANDSEEIKKELVLAGQSRLVVIPVRVEDVTPDEAFAYEFATRQWVDLFEDQERSIERLVHQLTAIAGVQPASKTGAGEVPPRCAEKPANEGAVSHRSNSSARPGSEIAAIEALNRGNEALNRNDYLEAMRWWHKAADQGDAEAQISIGFLYMHGFGVQQDYNEAVRWYRMAAEQGNPEAQRCIGFLYEGGSGGVEQDYATAMGWYRKAADQGHVGAQYHVGSMFANGWGVAPDLSEARGWMQKAADGGHDDAKKWLADN